MDTPTKPSGRRESPGSPEELDGAQCLELIRRSDVGRIAMRTSDDDVDIFPVNYIVDHGTIVFCTAAGRKLTSIDNRPTVAFEVDHFDWYERIAWSVVMKGAAERVTDRDEILRLLESELDSWQHDRKPYYVRITPTTTTGRRFSVRRRTES